MGGSFDFCSCSWKFGSGVLIQRPSDALEDSPSLGLTAQRTVLCLVLGACLSEFPVAAIMSSHKRRRIRELTVQEIEVLKLRFLQGSLLPQDGLGLLSRGRLDFLAHGSSSVITPFPCLSHRHFRPPAL